MLFPRCGGPEIEKEEWDGEEVWRRGRARKLEA
jgi:hypothetical protein